MTTDAMLGRLFALIHDSPPQTPAEFEADAAIRRTLEFMDRLKNMVELPLSDRTLMGLEGMIKQAAAEAVIREIGDFDPGQEDK